MTVRQVALVDRTSEVRTWPVIGGHPVIDLLNTVSWRLNPDRRTDALRTYADLLDWGRAVEMLADGEVAALAALAARSPDASAGVLNRAVALREAVHDAAASHDHRAVSRLTDEVRAADQAGALVHRDTGWIWADPIDLELPVRRIARAATVLFLSGDLSYLRQCADDECGWLFLDRSARHNRRWCVASDCGNRNRVRAHYARQRAEAS